MGPSFWPLFGFSTLDLLFPIRAFNQVGDMDMSRRRREGKKRPHLGVEKTLLRIPWTARRSNQSILKEISPEYSLEGLMMKLKLQYFGHLM